MIPGGSSIAPGAPGIAPTWSSSAKDAVGASAFSSRVWFTIGRGILNEVYWPSVDRPQIRDLGFIVADDVGFWSEVKRDAEHEVRYVHPGIPAVLVHHRHPSYTLALRICADDRADVVRIEAHLEDRRPDADPARIAHPLRLYPLLAPHLGSTGQHNHAWVSTFKGGAVVLAQNGQSALAMASTPEPVRQSVGYVGSSDGWQDFALNRRMSWTYDVADAGNVATVSELLPEGRPVQIALAFADRPAVAALQARAALVCEFEEAWSECVGRWDDFLTTINDGPAGLSEADRALYLTSAAVLRVHEDRTEPGATVASLSIPWGNTRDDLGGYHLVWSRDLVEAAGSLIALGAPRVARRTLAYLVSTQELDGHWVQNQWIDGLAYWSGTQLDEAAYPLLLVGALRRRGEAQVRGGTVGNPAALEHLLTDDSVDAMTLRAAGFIARTGPATQQDRWEENAGLTPSTLAPVIAALVVAAERLPESAARYCLELADDWNASIEEWTFARGTKLARHHGVDGYYVRIAPPEVLVGAPLSSPIAVRNRPPGDDTIAADMVIGTDFLALVRFGLRLADDPHVVATLAVADALLRTETPSGPVWHRYTGDGYGERADGSAFDGTGIGRGWPLLAGERGHYELAAGRDARPYLKNMRRMASHGGMLPEQVWDAAAVQAFGLYPGRPSGSAMPLVWAHAEYIKLARSIALGYPIDRPAAAWDRYHGVPPRAVRATWRFTAARSTMAAQRTLRLELLAPAMVRYSLDEWRTSSDLDARDTGLGLWVADLPGSDSLPVGRSVDFTFYWPQPARWEGRDFRVTVMGAGAPVVRS